MTASAQSPTGRHVKPLSVIIIGGSVAGLMQGIMLKRLGHNIQVLEQNRSSERLEGGTGITIGPDALEFFEKYDLMKRPFSVSNPGIQVLDEKAQLKRFMQRPMQMSSWNQLYCILRANFDGHKSNLCPEPPDPLKSDGKAVFSVGKKVTDVVNLDGIVTVRYEDLLVGGEHSLQGDLVIVADGASSRIRSILLPQIQRDYSGYLAWRGYVNESQLSEETRKAFDPRFTSYTCKGGYILSYIIPGIDGSLEPGKRRINWVWYDDCPDKSPAFTETLTDTAGHVHRNYLPIGQMRQSIWEGRLEIASKLLIPPMLELLQKTNGPAISVIHDYACPKAAFFDNKVLLVGDALALFRPHIALSFNQSGKDCLLLEKVMTGEIDIQTWDKLVTVYGARSLTLSEMVGGYAVYGIFAALRGAFKYARTFLPF